MITIEMSYDKAELLRDSVEAVLSNHRSDLDEKYAEQLDHLATNLNFHLDKMTDLSTDGIGADAEAVLYWLP